MYFDFKLYKVYAPSTKNKDKILFLKLLYVFSFANILFLKHLQCHWEVIDPNFKTIYQIINMVVI